MSIPSSLLLILGVLLALVEQPLAADTGIDTWLAAQQGSAFQARPGDERPQVEALFAQVFSAPDDPALMAAARALGWAPSWRECAQRSCLALADVARTGRGAYLFAPDPAHPVLLQAPHQFKDLHTGALALALLAEQPLLGAAFNTVARTAPGSDGEGADLARRNESDLIALSRAFAREYPAGVIVQLHGYSQAARRTRAAREAELIVSNGTRSPDGRTQAIFRCLRQSWGEGVRLYPWDVTELGGTRNPVGRQLRALGHAGFLHLEMSLDMRHLLRSDPAQRARFARCLLVH